MLKILYRGSELVWLVVYDISDNTIRSKVSNILKEFGRRVQYSSFEIECKEHHLKEILEKISSLIEPEDSVFFFPITKNMSSKVIEIGIPRKREDVI